MKTYTAAWLGVSWDRSSDGGLAESGEAEEDWFGPEGTRLDLS